MFNSRLSVVARHYSPNIISSRCIWYSRRNRVLKYIPHRRGLPPYKAKSLKEKLEDAEYKDPSVHYKVNIGLPQPVENKQDTLLQRAHFKNNKENLDLEKAARENKIVVPLEDVKKEWSRESAPKQIKLAAEYYGVFNDLFGDAFFYPQVNLDVVFKHEKCLIPVHRGNTIKPSQAIAAPQLSYNADPGTFWTLTATNPDTHLGEGNSEYLHWLLGNIPGSELTHSEVIADYIQPFPPRGTGFQRFVLILYKHEKPLNFSSLQDWSMQVDLKNRFFSTYDFYRTHQDSLTPAGLAFCLVDWDTSVSNFFHTTLEIEEPVYEYDFDPAYHPKQKTYPIRQPFNLYMDRYRDEKQIAKEYLLKKLKDKHPFEKPKPPLRFPNSVPLYHDLNENLFGRIPSWLKREKLKQRMGYGRINDY